MVPAREVARMYESAERTQEWWMLAPTQPRLNLRKFETPKTLTRLADPKQSIALESN